MDDNPYEVFSFVPPPPSTVQADPGWEAFASQFQLFEF
jgi:hypothetical protein